MAGGNYTTMNKIRPGAYFQRLLDLAGAPGISLSGTLAWIVPTNWGAPITEITIDDYNRDYTYRKLGIHNTDERLQVWAQYGERLIVANPLKGGVTAHVQIKSGLDAYARYTGVLGNELSLVVVAKGELYREVRTTLSGTIVDRQTIKSWSQFVDNDWITLVGDRSGAPSIGNPLNLSGGKNGKSGSAERIVSAPIAIDGADEVYYALSAEESSNFDVDGFKIKIDNGAITVENADGQVVGGGGYGPGTIAGEINLVDKGGFNIILTPWKLQGDVLVPLDMNHSYTSTTSTTAINGGNHGNFDAYDSLFDELRYREWNVLVCDDQSSSALESCAKYVDKLREKCGLYRRLVVCEPPSSYIAPVNAFNNDYITNCAQTLRGDRAFSAYIRACMSLVGFNESSTHALLPIEDAPDQMLTDEQIEAMLENGFSVISRRGDGLWMIEKDINTLHVYEDEAYYTLSKNRIIRTIDALCNLLVYIWDAEFCGKVTNDQIGRDMWKSRMIDVFEEFKKARAINSYVEPTAILGNKVDEVISEIGIVPLDSMEIVYIQLKLNREV